MQTLKKYLPALQVIVLAFVGVTVIAHYYVLPYYHQQKAKHEMQQFFQMDESPSSMQGIHS